MSSQLQREQRFADILQANRQLIYKVCYMYATDAENLKDLYQEVLANIWNGIDSFRSESKLSTWIYRVAINTCVAFFRKHSRECHASSLDGIVDVADPDDGTRLANLREMYRLINRLGRIDKAIVLLWLDEHSYDEISSIVGLTKNNVASRLHRARQKLKAESDC